MTLPELVCLAVLTEIGRAGRPAVQLRVGPSMWNRLRVCPEVQRVVTTGTSVGALAGIPIVVDPQVRNGIGVDT